MADLTINLSGGRRFEKRLNSLTKNASRGGVLKVMGATMQGDVLKTFRSGADPRTNKKWAPLSDLTKAWKGNGKTLQDTNRLLNSLTSQAPEYGLNSVTISTRGVRYAKVQQVGGVIKAKRGKRLAIPKNPKARRTSPSSFKGGQRKANYLFVKSVKIPSRPFLGAGRRLSLSMTQNVIAYLMDEKS